MQDPFDAMEVTVEADGEQGMKVEDAVQAGIMSTGTSGPTAPPT